MKMSKIRIPPNPPTLDEFREAILRSGYLLESRVAQLMLDRSIDVETNFFLSNPDDPDKALEVDVLGFNMSIGRALITTGIFIECKNNTLPVAFFAQKSKKLGVTSRIITGGFPGFLPLRDSTKTQSVADYLQMGDWHHYSTAKEIATQFCGFEKNKDQPLKAGGQENYSKSFSDLAKLCYLNANSPQGPDDEGAWIRLGFPVVVLQGELLRIVDNQGLPEISTVEHMQLVHYFNYRGVPHQVQIDVVTESYLPTLLDLIDYDVRTCRKFVDEHLEVLLDQAEKQRNLNRMLLAAPPIQTLGLTDQEFRRQLVQRGRRHT